MTEGSRWQFAGLIAALVVLHFVLKIGLQLGVFGPDLLIVALLLAARRLRAGTAAGLGLVFGLLDGGAHPFVMGASAVVYCVLGYLGGRAKDFLQGDNPVTLLLYLFAGKFVFDAGLWLLIATRGYAPPLFGTLVLSVLAAVYAAGVGLAVATTYRAVT
jgi:hypothetical protein